MTSENDIRDAAVRLKNFTVDGLAHELGMHRSDAFKACVWLSQKGIVRNEGPLRTGHRGRPPTLYRWIHPRELNHALPPADRANGSTPDLIGALPVAGAGKKNSKARSRRKLPPEVDRLVQAGLRCRGWSVEWHGNHPKLMPPKGKPISIPTSPSDHRTLANLRAEMRRKGVPV